MPWQIDPPTPDEQAQQGWLSRFMTRNATTSPMSLPGQLVPNLGPGYVADPNAMATRLRRDGTTGLPGPAPLGSASNAAADTAAYGRSVDEQQRLLQARQPSSQTTQAPPDQLPGYGPDYGSGGMMGAGLGLPGDLGLPQAQLPEPAPPPAAPAAPSRPPAALQGMGTDPGVFAGLDYMPGPPSPAPAQANPAAPTVPQSPATPTGATDPAAFARTDQRKPLTQEQLNAQWALTVGGESSGNSKAVNPKTGAAGLTQFIPSTLNAFLASPEGKGETRESYMNSPAVQRKAFDWLTQQNASQITGMTGQQATPAALMAAHAIGAGGAAALMLHPQENAVAAYNETVRSKNGQVALIGNNPGWGITAQDTAQQALDKINGYYQKTAGKGGGGQVATPVSAPAVPQAAPQAPQAAPGAPQGDPKAPDRLPGSGPDFDPMTYLQQAGYKPVTQSDKLMALAGGIFSGGPNFGAGMGAGIKAMQQLGQDDQQNRFKFMKEAADTAMAKQRLGLITAQTQQTMARIDQQDRKGDQADQGLAIKQQQLDVQQQRFQQQHELQTQRFQLAQTNADSLNSGLRTLNTQQAKESETAAKGLTSDIVTAGNDLQKIADLREVIGKEGLTGNDARTRVARFMAENLGINVGVSQDGFALGEKLISDFNSGAVLGTARGVISRMTQGEFMTFRQGVLNMGTSPQAALAMLESYEKAAQRRLEIGTRWNQLVTADPAAAQKLMLGVGGLNHWYETQVGGQLASRGITSTAPAPSQYAKPEGGTWQHVDPKSGLGFTLH